MAQVMPSVVEAGATGQDIAAPLPEISLHLDHGPDCRDLYQTLVEIARQPNP